MTCARHGEAQTSLDDTQPQRAGRLQRWGKGLPAVTLGGAGGGEASGGAGGVGRGERVPGNSPCKGPAVHRAGHVGEGTLAGVLTVCRGQQGLTTGASGTGTRVASLCSDPSL